MEFRVGDIVRVTDWGELYTTNLDWFKRPSLALRTDWLIRYSYGNSTNYNKNRYDDKYRYKILFIDDDENKILITFADCQNQEVYLIHKDGLELYDKPVEMTIEEIEEKLGIRNLKVIGERKCHF